MYNTTKYGTSQYNLLYIMANIKIFVGDKNEST